MNIKKELFKYKDNKYKEFNSKLIPNINKDKIIGVKTPYIREMAKKLTLKEKEDFLNNLPHEYQEENIMHAILLLNYKSDINDILNKIDKFLPHIDNWAVSDILSPIIFKKYQGLVLEKIKVWIKSSHEYTVRFAVVILLKHYLDDNFTDDINTLVLNINRKDYYINMSIAWYFSYALIKQYDKTIKIFENKLLDKWIHNKSIQKAIESYRISNDKKVYLKKLKIK